MKLNLSKPVSMFLITVAVLFTAFSISGCKEKGTDENKPELTIKQPASLVDAAAEESVIELIIESANTDWTVESSHEWVTADKTTGSGNATVKLTVAANETTEERRATVTVTATEDADLKHTLTINQAAKEEVSVLPADAGNIEGDDEGVGYVELSVPEIERADYYEWLLDGQVLPYASERTYTAFESGEYTVRGVNGEGRGKESAAKSVTILYDIDDLVGTYDVKAFLYTAIPKYVWDHTSVIEKIDATTVRIKYFFGIEGTMFDYQPSVENLDEVIATFDARNCTLTFNSNLIPIGYDENPDYETYLVPADFAPFCDNVGLEFPVYPVQMNEEDVIIDFQTGFEFTVDGQTGKATCAMVALNEQGECVNGLFNLSHAVFTKVSSETDSPIVRPTTIPSWSEYSKNNLVNAAGKVKFTSEL